MSRSSRASLQGAVKKSSLARSMGAASMPLQGARDVGLIRFVNSNARHLIAERREEETTSTSNTPSTASRAATPTPSTAPSTGSASSTAQGSRGSMEKRRSKENWDVVRDVRRAAKNALLARMFANTAKEQVEENKNQDGSQSMPLMSGKDMERLKGRLSAIDDKAAADKAAAEAAAAAAAKAAAAKAAADEEWERRCREGNNGANSGSGGGDEGAGGATSGGYDANGNLLGGGGLYDANGNYIGPGGTGSAGAGGLYDANGKYIGPGTGGSAGGARGGYYDENGNWVSTGGQYDANGKLIGAGGDTDGRTGYYDENGNWVDTGGGGGGGGGAGGYYDENGNWIDGEDIAGKNLKGLGRGFSTEDGSPCICKDPSESVKCPECGSCRTCGGFHGAGGFRGARVGCEACAEHFKNCLLRDSSDWRLTPIFDNLRLEPAGGITAQKLQSLFAILCIDRNNVTAQHVAAVLVCILIGKGNETAQQMSIAFNSLGINKDNITARDLNPFFEALSINKHNVLMNEMVQIFKALSIDKDSLTLEHVKAVFGALGVDRHSVTADHAAAVFGALGITKEMVTAKEMTNFFAVLGIDKKNVGPLHLVALVRALRIDKSNVTTGFITSLFSSLEITKATLTEDHLSALCQALGIFPRLQALGLDSSTMTTEQITPFFEALREEHEGTMAIKPTIALVRALGIDIEHGRDEELATFLRALDINKNNMIQKFNQIVILLEALGIGEDASKAGAQLLRWFRALDIDEGNEKQQEEITTLFQDILTRKSNTVLSQITAGFEAIGIDFRSLGISMSTITPQQLTAMLGILGNSIDKISAQHGHRSSIFLALGLDSGEEQDVDTENLVGQDVAVSKQGASSKKQKKVKSLQEAQETSTSGVLESQSEMDFLACLDGFSIAKAEEPPIGKAEADLDHFRLCLFDSIAAGADGLPWFMKAPSELPAVRPRSGMSSQRPQTAEGLGKHDDCAESESKDVLQMHASRLRQPIKYSKPKERYPPNSKKARLALSHQARSLPSPLRNVEEQMQSSAVCVEHVVCERGETADSLAAEANGAAAKEHDIMSKGSRFLRPQSSPALRESPDSNTGILAYEQSLAALSASPRDSQVRLRRIGSFVRTQQLKENKWLSAKPLKEDDPALAAVIHQNRCKSMKRTASAHVGHLHDMGPRNVWYMSLREPYNNGFKVSYEAFKPQAVEHPKAFQKKKLGSQHPVLSPKPTKAVWEHVPAGLDR